MSGSNSATSHPFASQRSDLQPPRSGKAVTFEDVSRLFTLPIAEAATSLGVCTSVLKRICRTNGIARWPYRQLLSGKTMEDIQKEAARERELSELAKTAKPVTSPSTTTQPSLGARPQVRSITHALSLESSKLPGVMPPNLRADKPQTERNNDSNVAPEYPQLRGIPNFVDEFKYGFPPNGLSHVSNKWWGSATVDGGNDIVGNNNGLPNGESSCTNYNGIDTPCQPVSKLVSLRRKCAKDGRESQRLGVSKGSGLYKLNAKGRTVLQQVFSTMPDQRK